MFLNEILGLVRIGERRWDIILKNDRKIMLPADGLERVYKYLMLEGKIETLLSSNFSVLDIRNPDRISVRQEIDPNKVVVETKLRSLEEEEI